MIIPAGTTFILFSICWECGIETEARWWGSDINSAIQVIRTSEVASERWEYNKLVKDGARIPIDRPSTSSGTLAGRHGGARYVKSVNTSDERWLGGLSKEKRPTFCRLHPKAGQTTSTLITRHPAQRSGREKRIHNW